MIKRRLDKIRHFIKLNIYLSRAHSYFMGSAAIVQFIPLITAPIIARLYTPEDFGAYAIFFGLVAIISTVAQLALHEAILLEDKESDAAIANLLSISVSVIMTILIFIGIFLIPDSFFLFYLGPEASKLLMWLPATIFVSSIYGCFYTWWIRLELYTELAKNKIILGISTAIIQISIGLIGLDAIGFVWANLLGTTLAALLLLKNTFKDMIRIDHNFNFKLAIKSLKKHKKLAIFTMPAGLVNTSASYMPDYFINFFFGVNTLGQYSLATRMINMPLSFLSVSVQDIFRQEASLEFNKEGYCKNTFNKFFLIMFIAALFIVVPLILLLPYIFPLFFGDQWLEAGYIIQPMILLISVRFISSPLSYVWIIRGHQGLDLIWQFGLVIFTLLSFILPSYFYEEVLLNSVLWIYSGICALWYLFCIFLSHRFANRIESN